MNFVYKTFLISILAIASATTYAESKDAKQKPQEAKKGNKPPPLTDEEKKLVEEAKKEFARARKEPPPSEHMQDKMQSGFGPAPTKGSTK